MLRPVRRDLNRATIMIATRRQFRRSSRPTQKSLFAHDTTAQFCAALPSTYAGRSVLRPYEEDSGPRITRLTPFQRKSPCVVLPTNLDSQGLVF
jgi:hypothetical protein